MHPNDTADRRGKMMKKGQKQRRSEIIRELSNLSRNGWRDARTSDYAPLEAELAALALALATTPTQEP